MNVLSLFDGISCGQVALNRAEIKYDTYYASEIDKYAIKITTKNYPGTIQIGDIKNVNPKKLPKINLLMGGSPCSDLSISGYRKGMTTKCNTDILSLDQYLDLKKKGFIFVGQSYLFWELVRLFKEIQPKYFLVENVRMAKIWKDIFSLNLGVEPIEINSALVSAQNRKRLYWTNIQNIKQPQDKGILLKDIIENGEVDRDKSYCIDANDYKGGGIKSYLNRHRRQSIYQSTRRLMVINKGGQGDRVYDINAKSVCLSANGGGRGAKTGLYYTNDVVRKLTPIECERLQTLPDNYTEGVSNTQRYKTLGNGWTVDVIVHILKCIQSKKL